MGKYLNHNLPQRKSIRLKNWDYSSPGYYFCTICTHRSEHFLGKIENGEMILSPEGKVVFSIWNEIPNQFQNAHIDSFVIMPNHIHGIIQIYDNSNISHHSISTDAINHSNIASNSTSTDAINRVRTGGDLKKGGGITGSKNPMLSQHNLGKIIRWYKGRCTYEIRQECNPGFGWHSRFYEHIIRNESSLEYIKAYIASNPKNWCRDRFILR
jgi:REP element-mobilizing transposase RayT